MHTSAWIWFHMADAVTSEPRPHFHCKRCDARELITVPISVEEFDAQARAFVALHRDCIDATEEDDEEDDGCPVSDPGCEGNDGDCHDACEAP